MSASITIPRTEGNLAIAREIFDHLTGQADNDRAMRDALIYMRGERLQWVKGRPWAEDGQFSADLIDDDDVVLCGSLEFDSYGEPEEFPDVETLLEIMETAGRDESFVA